jgi:hypothetical protein
LNVDLQDFFVQLYNLILEYRPDRFGHYSYRSCFLCFIHSSIMFYLKKIHLIISGICVIISNIIHFWSNS